MVDEVEKEQEHRICVVLIEPNDTSLHPVTFLYRALRRLSSSCTAPGAVAARQAAEDAVKAWVATSAWPMLEVGGIRKLPGR